MQHRADITPLFEPFLDHSAPPIKRILTAAETVLWRSGYGGMSIRDVASEAGVSKSLLHYHFKSKEHLLIEVQIGVFNRLAARVTEAVADIEPGAEAMLGAFDALFETLRQSHELPVLAELWARALTNPQLKAHSVRLREYLTALMVDTMERILSPDRAPLLIPLTVTADLMVAALAGLGLQAGVDSDPARVTAALSALRFIASVALGALEDDV